MRERSAANSPNTTVQAPQSPSAQPSFVPVRPRTSRKYSRTVCVGGTSLSSTISSSSTKRIVARDFTSSSSIHRIAPRRHQQRHVVVLAGVRDPDSNDGFFEEGRVGKRDAAAAEVIADLECQLITPLEES